MSKLVGWKVKFLSFTGRAVLVKSVMSAIPNHVMQGSPPPPPIHLCDKLDKINKALWGSIAEKRRMHLMGWGKIVRSKEEGGLEIQLARAKNIALLTKLNWRMYHEKDAIWARVILNKYCSNHRRSVENLDKLPSFPNWATIKLGFPTFSNGICWGLGRESRRDFWSDRWIKSQALRELIKGPLKREEEHLTIFDVYQGQEWKWEAFHLICH